MKRCALCVAAVVMVGMVALAWGADGPPERKEKPKPVPLVTVFVLDGAPVKGQMISADPKNVTVQPVGKANETPEPVVIPWAKIKSVSNGLTRDKAVIEFKKANVAHLCPTCEGDGVVYCPTCHGTGHDPASSADCKTCHGEGLVACKTPQCKDGFIPCPNTCLKDDGKWVEGHGHKRIKEFPGGGWVADAHIGELLMFDHGRYVGLGGTCPTCGGKTIIDDPVCEGGKVPCPTCKARKDAAACPANCEKGFVECSTCKGTGLKI